MVLEMLRIWHGTLCCTCIDDNWRLQRTGPSPREKRLMQKRATLAGSGKPCEVRAPVIVDFWAYFIEKWGLTLERISLHSEGKGLVRRGVSPWNVRANCLCGWNNCRTERTGTCPESARGNGFYSGSRFCRKAYTCLDWATPSVCQKIQKSDLRTIQSKSCWFCLWGVNVCWKPPFRHRVRLELIVC